MNVNDTEIAWSILQDAGYHKTDEITQVKRVMMHLCHGFISDQ